MPNKMLIDATHPEETRVVVLRGQRVEEFDFESASRKQLRGNIYLAKVTRVEPSLQAAFVDYGGNRHGFLAFSEIHPDYYQIPVADRQALIAAEEREAREAEERATAAERRREAAMHGSSDLDDEAEADAEAEAEAEADDADMAADADMDAAPRGAADDDAAGDADRAPDAPIFAERQEIEVRLSGPAESSELQPLETLSEAPSLAISDDDASVATAS